MGLPALLVMLQSLCPGCSSRECEEERVQGQGYHCDHPILDPSNQNPPVSLSDAAAGILKAEQIPFVATADSMQGKESRLVIYDWVVSGSNKTSDLSFTVDDHRGNIGQTLMTEALLNMPPRGSSARK
jgi:hypothetical protein